MKYVVFGSRRDMLLFSRNNGLKLGRDVVAATPEAIRGVHEAMAPLYFPHEPTAQEVDVWLELTTINAMHHVYGEGDWVPLKFVLSHWRDGDEIGWEEEFRFLRENHEERMNDLASSIRNEGIKRPILLGGDGRVWDGHHRLCAAAFLGMHFVPVEYAHD